MLQQITMSNFKKFNSHQMDFNSGLNEIKRTNESGKTTIADAVSFVLFGKLNNGSSDLTKIKPTHNPKAKVSVELVFVLEDNRKLVLKREYGEVWSRPRGGVTEEFSGHASAFYINGVKQSTEKDYTNMVLQAFNCSSVDLLQSISNPYYFGSNLTAKQRLQIISPIFNITHDSIMTVHPEFKDLQQDFINSNYDVESVTKDIQQKHKAKSLKVAELGTAVETLAPTTFISTDERDLAKATISKCNQGLTSLDLKKSGANDLTVSALRTDLLTIQAQHSKSQQADNNHLNDNNKKVYEAIAEFEKQKNKSLFEQQTLSRDIDNLKRDIASYTNTIGANNAKLAELKANFINIQKEAFEAKETICQYCGSVHTTTQETFNRLKAERLTKINQEGSLTKESTIKLEEAIKGFESSADTKSKEIETLVEAQNGLVKKISAERNNLLSSYESEATKALAKRIEDIKKNITDELANAVKGFDYETEKRLLETELANAEKVIADYNAIESARLKTLEKTKELNAATDELAALEVKRVLIQMYRKAKLEMMESKASTLFPSLSFQFIEANQTVDSYNEVCNIIVKADNGTMVQFVQSNTATQIKVGVKFCALLAKAIGASQPTVMIDNSEAITDDNRHFETKSQVIALVAQDEVETESHHAYTEPEKPITIDDLKDLVREKREIEATTK